MAFRPHPRPFRGPPRGIPNVVDLKFNLEKDCLITLNGGIIDLSKDICDKIKAAIGNMRQGGSRDSPVAGPADAPAPRPRPRVIPCLDGSNCHNVDCEKHHLNSFTDKLAPGKFGISYFYRFFQ